MAALVLKDTAVIVMTKGTARTRSVPKCANNVANVSKAMHVTSKAGIVFQKPTVLHYQRVMHRVLHRVLHHQRVLITKFTTTVIRVTNLSVVNIQWMRNRLVNLPRLILFLYSDWRGILICRVFFVKPSDWSIQIKRHILVWKWRVCFYAID